MLESALNVVATVVFALAMVFSVGLEASSFFHRGAGQPTTNAAESDAHAGAAESNVPSSLSMGSPERGEVG